MDLIEGEGLVFQRKNDETYFMVSGFPGRGSYQAGVLSRGIIAGEDVFVHEFQVKPGIRQLVVSEEELRNPELFTEIGVPGTRDVPGKEDVPGIYPSHLYK